MARSMAREIFLLMQVLQQLRLRTRTAEAATVAEVTVAEETERTTNNCVSNFCRYAGRLKSSCLAFFMSESDMKLSGYVDGLQAE